MMVCKKIDLNKLLIATVIAAASSAPSLASDYYDAGINAVKLREVAVGDLIFKKVDVGLGTVRSFEQGDPKAAMSSYSLSDGVLSIPFIRVGNFAATNVGVTLTSVLAVGSELNSATQLASGETYATFRAAALAAWQEQPNYIDPAVYQEQLRQMASSTSCFGFYSEDLIPRPLAALNWASGHLNELYPLHTTRYARDFTRRTEFPDPFVNITTNANQYGTTDERVTTLRFALSDRLISLFSSRPDPLAREELKTVLLNYARANALSEGLLTNWSSTVTPNTPVHFEVMPLTLGLIHAFDQVVREYSSADRQLVGDWLNRLVSRVLVSAWGSGRQDNKVYYRTQVGLAWGVLTGQSDLVRNAILIFKHAVNEIRPDGSFINESSRGGSANLYQSQATDSVLSLGLFIEENLGLPALSFSIDGKAVWTAAGRTLDAYEDQVRIASEYGKTCEGGSYGTVANPDYRWGSLQGISFLRVGLRRDHSHPSIARIRAISWDSYYYPERAMIDLMSLIGD